MDIDYYRRVDDVSANSWEKVNGNYGPDYTPSDLQDILQRTKRDVDASPKVTIKIEQKTGKDKNESTYSDGNTSIKVKRAEFGNIYYEYTHYLDNNKSFTLKDATYNDAPISVKPKFSNTHEVTSVSVYYWKYLDSGQPLLIKIVKGGRDRSSSEIWHRKDSTHSEAFDWTTVSASESDRLNVLNTLNSGLNSVVEISIDERPTLESNEAIYGHIEHDKKITVRINPDIKFFGFAAHEHYMKNSSGKHKEFHVSGFEEGNTPLVGIEQLPFLNVEYVIVFSSICERTLNERALLIYVRYEDEQESKWFNRRTLETVGKDWEETLDLRGKNPHSINNKHPIEKKLRDLAAALGIVCEYQYEIGGRNSVLGGSSGTNSLPGLGGSAGSRGFTTSHELGESAETAEEGNADHLYSVTGHDPVSTVQSTLHGEANSETPAGVISNPPDNTRTAVIVVSTLVALALFASVIYISYKYVRQQWRFRI